ncbi:MAG: regulatory protein RecX [Enterovibrio sp.]
MKATCRDHALRLLAMRDHSEKELRQKLHKKQYAEADIADALNFCKKNGWIQEQQVAENFLQQCVLKGYGWLRICSQAKLRGINANRLVVAVKNGEYDWDELAFAELKRCMRGAPLFPLSMKERQKWQNYLLRRGFSYAQIEKAFLLLSQYKE